MKRNIVELKGEQNLSEFENTEDGGISKGAALRNLNIWSKILTWPWCHSQALTRCQLVDETSCQGRCAIRESAVVWRRSLCGTWRGRTSTVYQPHAAWSMGQIRSRIVFPQVQGSRHLLWGACHRMFPTTVSCDHGGDHYCDLPIRALWLVPWSWAAYTETLGFGTPWSAWIGMRWKSTPSLPIQGKLWKANRTPTW